MSVTPSLRSQNSDEFFSSLLFPSGTAVSPEGEASQGEHPLESMRGLQTLKRRRFTK